MKQLIKERLFGKNKNSLILFLSFFILMTFFAATVNADVNKWTPQNSGVYNPPDVMTFASDFPNAINVYAGTGSYLGTGGFIYKSIDGGIKWDEKLNSLPFGSYVYALQVDPTDSKIIYAGTYNGVYKTTDGGLTWSISNGSPRSMTDDFVFALAINPSNHNRIYAGTRGGVNSPNSGKVFLSEDGGASWVEKGNKNNGLSNVYVLSLLIDPSNPLTIYAGTTGGSEQSAEKSGGVYKTTNGGLSWTVFNVGFTSTWVNALAFDPTNSNIIYAATSDGVFKSINSGSSWVQYKKGIIFQHISSVIVDPRPGKNNIVYAGAGFKPYGPVSPTSASGGVYRSIDGGENWTPINTGFKQAITGDISTRVYSMSFKPGDYNTVYAGTNDGIYAYSVNTNAPKTPTGFRLVEEGDRKVVLGWNANTEIDLAGYRVYRWDPVSKLYAKQGDDVPFSKVTFTDGAVANNVTYFYRLSAFNIAGIESPQTDYISATPKAYVEPPPPPSQPMLTLININGTKGNNNWYVDLPLITFSVNRNNPTTYYTWDYRFENTEWIVYKEPLITSEGKHTLYYYSKDNIETEEPYKFNEIKVDLMSPEITKIEPVDNSGIVNFKPVISADYSDTISGIDKSTAKIYLDGEDKTSEAVITETSISYTPLTDLSEGLHTVKVTVKDKAGNPAEATWSFKILAQFTIQLYKGWNSIALPINPSTPFAAQSLLDLINSQEGDVTQIAKWDKETQSWIIHINNIPINNFEIKPCGGYFIKSNKNSEFTLTGTSINSPVPIGFYKDWNLAGIPYPIGKYTAQTLLDEINKQGGDATLIVKWDTETQSWIIHINNVPINDFEIKPDEGYFIKTGKASEFIP